MSDTDKLLQELEDKFSDTINENNLFYTMTILFQLAQEDDEYFSYEMFMKAAHNQAKNKVNRVKARELKIRCYRLLAVLAYTMKQLNKLPNIN